MVHTIQDMLKTPKINMSPEKGPILEDSFIFKPSFLGRDMLFRVGVFFKTFPEQGVVIKVAILEGSNLCKTHGTFGGLVFIMTPC